MERELRLQGPALAFLRRRSGKTQEEVAAAAAMARSQVSDYENGRTVNLKISTLVRYLRAVEADLYDLYAVIEQFERRVGK